MRHPRHQDEDDHDDGQTADVHSISAGLDYPGVGPEHSYWKDIGRIGYTACADCDALIGFDAMARFEGIIPALETAHAVFAAMQLAATLPSEQVIVICLSGRGEKDAAEVARLRARIEPTSQAAC